MIEEIVKSLFEISAIKRGDFTLKSGQKSSIYIDLRSIISYPYLINAISDLIADKLIELNDVHTICGVPYSGLFTTTLVSQKTNTPMIMLRKEIGNKEYGLKKEIEGHYELDDHCVVIEDVTTTGQSTMDLIKRLRANDIIVKDVIVFLDRQQGATQLFNDNGIMLHSILTLNELTSIAQSLSL